MTGERSGAIEDTTRRAIAGDRNALDEIVRLLQPDLYGLALRMLWNREDAEDATQEMIPQDSFRKRLQRARAAIAEFTKAYCGLVSDTASCHCSRRIRAAVDLGRVNPERLQFAMQAQSFVEARATIRLLDNVKRPLAVHHSGTIRHPDVDFARRLLAALDSRVAGDRAT